MLLTTGVQILIALGQFFVHCKNFRAQVYSKEADKHIYSCGTILLELLPLCSKKGIRISHVSFSLTSWLLPYFHQTNTVIYFILPSTRAFTQDTIYLCRCSCTTHRDTQLRSWAPCPEGGRMGAAMRAALTLVPRGCLPTEHIGTRACRHTGIKGLQSSTGNFPSCGGYFTPQVLQSAGR